MKGSLLMKSWKSYSISLQKARVFPQPPHGCLHLLVLQGVDQGFSRGDDSEGVTEALSVGRAEKKTERRA